MKKMVKNQKTITIGSFNLDIIPEIYVPGEDTFLLEDVLREVLKDSKKIISVCYELGCGSGYLSLIIKSILTNCFLFASDVNPNAIEVTKNNLKKNNLDLNTSVFVSDLFDSYNKIKIINDNKKIDLLIFNPPYIPGDSPISREDVLENALIGGGTTGDDIIIRFLKTLEFNKKDFFSKSGRLIILISSWNKKAKNWIETKNHFKIVNRIKKQISHETLFCYVLTIF
ncbi:MAG: Release factor glutamine methyltransferase [Candidatus Heimdallarchaeota archaeon LC_3]|nr:MAG: Release factor glutamine methyltransferase [Candidatus Heimdallarchaeota archaeon LC_3]